MLKSLFFLLVFQVFATHKSQGKETKKTKLEI
jgi:hypothetical protein